MEFRRLARYDTDTIRLHPSDISPQHFFIYKRRPANFFHTVMIIPMTLQLAAQLGWVKKSLYFYDFFRPSPKGGNSFFAHFESKIRLPEKPTDTTL